MTARMTWQRKNTSGFNGKISRWKFDKVAQQETIDAL